MLTTGYDRKGKERFPNERRVGVKTLERTERKQFEEEMQGVSGSEITTPFVKKTKRLTVTDTVKNTSEVQSINKASVQKREKLSTKNVVMMIAYTIVAVALSVVIALNAVSLGSLTEKNNALAEELSSLETTFSAVNQELSAITNPAMLNKVAVEQLDLTQSSAVSVDFTVPGYKTPETKVFENNWFDNFLDSLAG